MDFAEILIVDDEMSIRNALRRELRFKVAAVHTAENAAQALEVLDAHHIDLIITDYRMPMMTGTELLLEVKQRHPEVPAIMLSGQADLSGVTAAINAGVLNQYVDKPWDANKLVSAITTTLHDHDPVRDRRTQMATRRELDRRLALLPEHTENGRPWLLVIVDIAELDAYNNTHGKASGNTLIQQMAIAIQRSTDQIWYRADDKFVTLTEYSAEGHRTIDTLSQRIKAICSAHPQAVDMRCYVSEAKQWDGWNKQQMSSSKANALPINAHVYWLVQEGNRAIAEEYTELSTLIQDLDQGKVEAFFQPQLALETGDITHCEALVRRRLPDNSYQSPADFLHLIHKYDLDDMLTAVMLRHAVAMLKRKGAPGTLTVSVNVTAKQLITGYAQRLLHELEPHPAVVLSDIELEVVESDQIFDYPRALTQFHQLHDLGITIAMDDFGTGYSGFESLCELPFDAVKIDGRFVRALGNNLSDEVILSSITNSAKSLKMEVVAEWVEKRRQAKYLKRKGCTRIQGYLVSPPLPLDEFLYFLDNRVTGAEL
ncbi:EAL domain-containing protein [Vibrio sp. Of14-4]|uniref:EAL domain-containing protein n=1 Tax=Vibrio sp. Of14-4 TaxID=2724878 RepID=UPI001EF2A3D8|nr:EAL domain-containing protein [Vibrio sp. Of14-4]MCG7490956.1 EAL domain-containing protein [Vibrio sp. Of14-4]